MKSYDVACPICKKVNKNLFLEETNGWMECKNCCQVVRVLKFEEYKGKRGPLLTSKQAALLFSKAN